MSNEGYDSDNQGDKPKDGKLYKNDLDVKDQSNLLTIDFKFYGTVFKVEEKKIVNHARWEQITAIYW
jgi:hypothetical protein